MGLWEHIKKLGSEAGSEAKKSAGPALKGVIGRVGEAIDETTKDYHDFEKFKESVAKAESQYRKRMDEILKDGGATNEEQLPDQQVRSYGYRITDFSYVMKDREGRSFRFGFLVDTATGKIVRYKIPLEDEDEDDPATRF